MLAARICPRRSPAPSRATDAAPGGPVGRTRLGRPAAGPPPTPQRPSARDHIPAHVWLPPVPVDPAGSYARGALRRPCLRGPSPLSRLTPQHAGPGPTHPAVLPSQPRLLSSWLQALGLSFVLEHGILSWTKSMHAQFPLCWSFMKLKPPENKIT